MSCMQQEQQVYLLKKLQISNNDIDLVIFLRDPVASKNYEPDIGSVLRLCDIHNIPLASNLATAEALLLALDRGDLDWRHIVRES